MLIIPIDHPWVPSEWTCVHKNCNRTIRRVPKIFDDPCVTHRARKDVPPQELRAQPKIFDDTCIDVGEAESLAADYLDRVNKIRLLRPQCIAVDALQSEELPLSDGCSLLLIFQTALHLSNAMSRNRGRQGGARAPAAPTMHVHHPHIGEVISVSANGRTATTHTHVVHSQPAVPEYIQEDSFTNAAVESWEFSYDLGDTALVGEIQPADADGIRLTAKKRVYKNSDYPMLTWATHQDEYLDEVLRLEGRGYLAVYSTCGGCRGSDPTFRCEHQMCNGSGLFCKRCIVQQHAVLPTHWIQDLGLVVQLGHPAGYSCDNPWKAHQDFVIIDVTGVHNVNVNYCLCDSKIERWQQLMRVCWWPGTVHDPKTCATFAVVHLFRTLNCLGKVSAHDFLRSLELLSNNDGLNPVFDRRRAFHHIVRQYRTISMMKRAGRGHHPSGVAGTAQGELALPWSELSPAWEDCNFRLINRNVSTAAKDPILGDGYGYFVNNVKYTEWICAHVTEEEISTCLGFQAMFLANRKHVKGLRTTGVGGVTCARHNMWRPNGIGDLQLGKRQMAENVKEGQVHRDAFEAFDAALRETAPEMVESWKNWVHQWESRQHTDGTESLFELKEKVTTLREIKNKLAREELLKLLPPGILMMHQPNS
ncbi:hypothetical protein B0H14DRAFT_3683366 [Mycena olivaceomarginata]|nr:hypothetical protein B0H14DRAFT_3683366 [Mycena olivaceomarginata]